MASKREKNSGKTTKIPLANAREYFLKGAKRFRDKDCKILGQFLWLGSFHFVKKLALDFGNSKL